MSMTISSAGAAGMPLTPSATGDKLRADQSAQGQQGVHRHRPGEPDDKTAAASTPPLSPKAAMAVARALDSMGELQMIPEGAGQPSGRVNLTA
jgi:hypothetical protein